MQYYSRDIPLDYAAAGLVPPEKQSKITLYNPDNVSEAVPRRRAVVVLCPGGGYSFVAPREGEPIALQYLAADIAVVELTYAVYPSRFPVALFELAATVRWIRENAEALQIDPARVIVSGFSAGGHLAASLCVYWNQDFLARGLGCGGPAIQPNGAILCYAVISGEQGIGHRGSLEALYGAGYTQDQERAFSLEKQVGPHCPPTFLWHTAADTVVPAANSLCYAEALGGYGIPFELHIYPWGEHGLSLATAAVDIPETPQTNSLRLWPSLAIEWIKRQF
ncbi:MAG: alpha/beta hydrolase [Spirochaetaceae bacterium]|jgi:acetyl esterase/lipase|nr:alpha/beta hydrolase [Spirochaetaceae bacterium]